MGSIPADAASYYATYNLGEPDRRDNNGGVIPGAAGGQQLAAHGFFHHQTANQHQQSRVDTRLEHPHHQSPHMHATMPQYHTQQRDIHHQPQAAHASMAQYQSQQQQQQQQQQQHIGAMTGADPAGAYQAGGFTHYAAHAAYHPNHSAAGFDPNTGAPVDSTSAAALASGVEHDYSVMAVAGALHTSTPPINLHQVRNIMEQPMLEHPHAVSNNGMRFDCVLEAPTAAAQKADEPTLTYLNKGQLYGISLLDKTHSDTFYSTTLRIAFHEDSHRKSAPTYWNFWLNQQENPRAARAIELDKAGSIGVVSAEDKQFDRVTFQWQGRRGAKVMVRFNCLSTDFSRIKGVKGIPLRIHLDTHYALSPSGGDMPNFASSLSQMSSPIASLAQTASTAIATSSAQNGPGALSTPVSPAATSGATNPLEAQTAPTSSATATFSPATANTLVGSGGAGAAPAGGGGPGAVGAMTCGKIIERCSARIKLFRDKGAERKNKDDQRHLDKLWEKQKAKLALSTGGNQESGGASSLTQQQQIQQQLAEFTMTFAPVQPITTFVEYTLTGDECDNEDPIIFDEIWTAGGQSVSAAAAAAAAALESPGSVITTPITGLSTMNLGMPGMHLTGLGSPMTSTAAAMAYMRKRSADDLDIMSPNKRHFSPASLPTAINGSELVGVDPTYTPMPRKRKAVLAIYVKFQGENIYRAIYLERLAVDDLVAKLTQRLEIQAAPDIEVIRKTKKGLTVKVDNGVIAQLDDQQDMEVECSFAKDTGNLTIYLHY
ncbi:hypothetical protein GGI15_003652 [Coemansia interrupta]|uniref:Grh/CP2 DB domain-containing protein n=1 Tax=Coemansia interrupta TaxID=1126814 RepID=A0A9W8H6G4_9FUNG|nr:hypothetical protein GGI15_003652 [Coemansia interrupta]